MEFQDWVNFSAIVGGIFALPAFVLTAIGLGTSRIDREEDQFGEIISDVASRRKLVTELRHGWSVPYSLAIEKVLTWSKRIWGENLSLSSLSRCFSIALFYPFISLILSWIFSHNTSPGGISLFVDTETQTEKNIRFSIFVVGSFFSYWIAVNSSYIFDQIREDFSFLTWNEIVNNLKNHGVFGIGKFLTDCAFFILLNTISITSILGAAFTAFFFAVMGFISIATPLGMFVFALSATLSVLAAAVGVSFTLITALILAFFVSSNLDAELASIWVLIYILLPVINGLADFLSITVTRAFLEQIKPHSKLFELLGKLSLDVLWALVCLVVLIFLTVFSLEVWSVFSPENLPLNWENYWKEVQSEPWRLHAIYLMIFTTLLPTMIHVAAGLGAIITHRSRKMSQVADILEASGESDLSKIEKLKITRLMRSAIAYGRWLGWSCSLGLTLGLFAILVWMVTQV